MSTSLVLFAERVNVSDIRERFAWYKAPNEMTADRAQAHVFPSMDSLQATARAIDARGGWLDYVNVAAQEA